VAAPKKDADAATTAERSSVLRQNGRALLAGSSGRFPYNGHFRLRVEGFGATLYAAGRVGASRPPHEAWPSVCALHALLSEATGRNRLSLLRDAWERLIAAGDEPLGPGGARSLVLLLVARDTEGVAVAGVGLGGLLGLREDAARAVVPGNHPLLGEPGLPSEPPRALEPRRESPVFAAWGWGEAPLPEDDLEAICRRCGVIP